MANKMSESAGETKNAEGNEEGNVKESVKDNANVAYTTHQWQRLSPIAIVYFGVSFIQGIIGQFIYIAPALLLGYNSIKDSPWVGLPIAIGLFVFLLSSALLSFYFFQFRLSKNSIEIRSGVLSKKHANLPFSRIQNVKIEQPIYYRAMGFACLTLDTAGSSKQEAKVVALPLNFAEKLKQEIMGQHTEEAGQSIDSIDNKSSVSPSNNAEKIINTRSIKDLVIHGVTSNRIWIFLGVLAPFYEQLSKYVGDFLQRFDIDASKLFDPSTHSIWQLGLYTLSMTMMIMLMLSLFSIFGAIMTFYGFTLSKVEDRYIRRSGLFTKHEVSMRVSRLQKIAHKRDWLDMLLGRVNLRFEQSNTQIGGMENSGVANITDKIIVPSVTTIEALSLTLDVYPENTLENINFTAISKRFFIRYIGGLCAPIFLVVLTLLVIVENYSLILPVTGVFVFACVLIFMRWKRWGYAIDDKYLYVRKGIFGVDHFVFPIFKVQQTVLKQSKFMKRRQLCSLSFILASGAVDIPFIKEAQGRELINRSLYEVETSGKSWM
ncbi:MAG: PH domain-containing protein [Cognaticolwellia sp.]